MELDESRQGPVRPYSASLLPSTQAYPRAELLTMEAAPTEGAGGTTTVDAGETTTTGASKKTEGWRKYVEECHSGNSAAAVAFVMKQEGIGGGEKPVVSDRASVSRSG